MADEIGAIGHFNMGTFEACGIGVDGSLAERISVPPASTFAPRDVEPEQWIKALASACVKRAVLVVSHGCGFNTVSKIMNFVLKTRNFVSTTRNFVFKMMNFVFKMVDFVDHAYPRHELQQFCLGEHRCC